MANFIKLTRFDNSPIWINAAFVVTIEPRKNGGSIVVPIGDGLDYEVRESVEQILPLLGAATAPTVVPVPTPQALTHAPAEAPSIDNREIASEPPAPAAKPAKRTTRKAKTADDTTAKTPTKRTSRKAKTPPAPASEKAATLAPIDESAAPLPQPSSVSLASDQLERLRKMAPKSVRKLLNTLKVQFKVEAAESLIQELQNSGILSLDREHVLWQ